MKSSPRPSSRTNKYTQNFTTLSRSFDSMNLDKFPDFMTLNQYSNLSFCHNPITSFLTLPLLSNLTSLKLDSTKISSFNGAKTLPQLSSISMLFTPVCSSKYFYEMCLIAFGTQLIRINDKIVSSKQKKFARDNMEILNKYITTGWLITKGNQPIHLLHYQTRKRICFYTVNKQTNQNRTLEEEMPSYDNNYTPISKSRQIAEQNSGPIIYESSFATDSGDNNSNKNSINNTQFQLDEKARDDLLSKMIQLSREWNPPRKIQSYEKDNFLENNLFELFQPSMAKNRRLVVRDQRPANLFKRPVSIQTESPYADEKKPYLQRKREEYELKNKQKLDQLNKEEEEFEYVYEEEEEEEEIEELEEQEKVKDENEMQLQDNLKEENNVDNNDTINKNDVNNNNQEEVDELNMLTKEEEDLNEIKENNDNDNQKENETTNVNEIASTNETPNANETIKVVSRPQFKQVLIKRKSMPSASKSARVIRTPTNTDQDKATNLVNDDNNNNNSTTNLLSESEMEVFRKRRMMSMNKFILTANSPKPKPEKPENPEQSHPIIDDKIVKRRRKTLTHSKTTKNIETPGNDLDKNSKSSTNLSTPRNQNRLARRPTYSEIMSSRYKQQHDQSFPSYQKDQLESSFKVPQSERPARKLSMEKRKTSFATLDIEHFFDPKAKTRVDAGTETETTNLNETELQNENDSESKVGTEVKFMAESKAANKADAGTETEIQTEIETETGNQNETETETEIGNQNETETGTETIDKAEKANENENKVETETETENQNETETEIINKTESKDENEAESKNEVETESKDDNASNANKEDDKNEEKSEEPKDEAKIDSDLLNEINLNQDGENDKNGDLIDDEINQFLQEQNTLGDKKTEEEEGKNQTESEGGIEELKDIENLHNLDDILKGIDDDDDDLDDAEAELRIEAFQEFMKEHPDKADDDDFMNDYIEQYLKTHLKK